MNSYTFQEPLNGADYRPNLSNVVDVLSHIESLLDTKLDGKPITITDETGERHFMKFYEVLELVAEMVANVKQDVEQVQRELLSLAKNIT